MSLELNKIAASVLTAGVVAMGSAFFADLLVSPHAPEEPAYKVAMKDEKKGDEKPAKPKGPKSIVPMLASADASAGETASRACTACHSFNKGGPNKIGPNLYGVVGNKIASVEGFSYSDALKGKEGKWTYAKLNKWLHNPSKWAPGTSMSYNGVKDAQKRANLVAYMRELDDSPMPLPSEDEVQAAKQASGGGEQAADGGEQMAKAEGSADAGASGDGDAGGSGSGSDAHAMIAKASAAKGESAVAVCKACHSFNKGGPNKVGPNLYNVVGSDIASVEGFSYSDALKGKEGTWTYDKLWAYLENPQGWAPGTNMSYPGVSDAAKRANIIAYLKQQSENPPKLERDSAAASDAGGTQEATAETGGDGGDNAGASSAADGGDSATSGGDTAGDSSTERDASASEDAGGDGSGDQAKADNADGSGDQAKADNGDAGSASQTAKAAASGSPIHGKIASASASKGATAAAVCKACHSFNKGGPNKVGPNLYGVVGSDIASMDGFSYTDALAGKDGAWTYEKLWNYLENPQKWAPGTNMSYPGVKDPAKRANIIAYLKQQADDAPKLNP
jgi:cytochrome c